MLPTYNERENVAALLAAVRRSLPDADVLVVDDNSPDGTAALVEEAASELGQIKLLRRPGKQGLGSAYRNGFAVALDEGYDVIVSMDVDFSHDPAVLPELLALIDAGADAVIGSRYVPGRGDRRLAAAPPPAVALGQPLHVARARAAGPRLHVRVPRLPGRGAGGDRPGDDRRPRATPSSPSSCAASCAPATG